MRHRARRDAEARDVVGEIVANSSGRTRKLLFEHRRVRVNGRVARPADRVRAGDVVEIASASPPADLPPGLDLVHEDADVIVVRKAQNLLTIATPKERERTAFAYLSAHVKRTRPSAKIFVVHRLDKLASGLVVFAKTPGAKAGLQAQFAAHTVERIYVAVVSGRIAPPSGTLTSRIEEGEEGRVRETKSEKRGRRAITHYRVLEEGVKFSLVELKLETGRKNQIRVQLQGIGRPIAGDEPFGSRVDPIRRLALHARVLAFDHPRTGERLRFEDAIPPPFVGLVRSKPAPRTRSGNA